MRILFQQFLRRGSLKYYVWLEVAQILSAENTYWIVFSEEKPFEKKGIIGLFFL